MSFTDEMRLKVDSLWRKEHNHPFVQGIGAGTLPIDRFKYYLKQDFVFLIGFSRAIAIAISKAPSLEDMSWFSELLNETLNTEMDLHLSYCEEFGLSKDEIAKTLPSPTTEAYVNHLLQVANTGSTIETAVAILPCSWGYSEIGKKLESQGLPNEAPLYKRWIEMYSSSDFEELAIDLRNFIDREQNNLPDDVRMNLVNIFFKSSEYEYRFWNAAFNKEGWQDHSILGSDSIIDSP